MNVKRWLPWVGLMILIVTQALLFRANSQLTSAQADLREARQQVDQLQVELDQLKSSSVATLSLDNARLRQENQLLNRKLAQANNDVTQLTKAGQQLAQQLQTARKALGLQQDHLQQLAAEPPPAPVIGVEPAAAPESNPIAQKNACINNLHLIDVAKQQWALENSKGNKDTPTEQELAPFFKGNTVPLCHAGGAYLFGTMDELPVCSVPGHVLP